MAEVFREAVMEPVAVMEVYVVESLNAGPTGWSPVRLEVDGTLVLHTGPYMNADRSRELTSRIPDYALLIHRLNGQASESRWPPGPLLSSLFCSGRGQPWFCLVVNWFI